jgi:hypothetical protein
VANASQLVPGCNLRNRANLPVWWKGVRSPAEWPSQAQYRAQAL